MKVWYHCDLDGEAAAHCIYKYYLNKNAYRDDFLWTNYNKPFPLDIIKKDEEVWIVDFSINPNDMEKLLMITKNVIWIDHHITAIEKYENFPYEIKGLRYDGIAGCELTYAYIKNLKIPEQRLEIPFIIRLVGDQDTWGYLDDQGVQHFRYGTETKNFSMGAACNDTHPFSPFWEMKSDKILQQGKIAIAFRKQLAIDFMHYGFETIFEGYKAFAMNMPPRGSEYFESIDRNQYDFVMPFAWNGKEWVVSMYSENRKGINLGVIAKKYGGGGHKGAAGFHCKELPFKKLENQNEFSR